MIGKAFPCPNMKSFSIYLRQKCIFLCLSFPIFAKIYLFFSSLLFLPMHDFLPFSFLILPVFLFFQSYFSTLESFTTVLETIPHTPRMRGGGVWNLILDFYKYFLSGDSWTNAAHTSTLATRSGPGKLIIALVN